MGCISSKPDVCEENPHMYHVVNIDADGNSICAGNLTLTRAELTLHCPNCEPMRWPLSGLRRYGCEADVFSIEAGRHCQCAEGVYSFRCDRAHQLFLTLQMYIQNPGFQAHLRPSGGGTGLGVTAAQQQQQQQQHQRGPAMPRRTAGMGNGANNGGAGGVNGLAGGVGGGGYGGATASGMPLSDLVGGPYTEPVQHQHRSLLGAAAVTHPQSLPLRNLRHGSVTGGPLSPDGLLTTATAGGQQALHAAITPPMGDPAGGIGGATSNLYQECSAATTAMTRTRSPVAGTGGTNVSFETNNNQILHNKKLSLDIPPAEPAPSPSSNFAACGPLLSPAAHSYYHNEFPDAANYANAAAALAEFHNHQHHHHQPQHQQHQQLSATPFSCGGSGGGGSSSSSSAAAYMNVTVGESTALLSPVPETPRSTHSFPMSPTTTTHAHAAAMPTTPLTLTPIAIASTSGAQPTRTAMTPSASAGTAPLLWTDCTAAAATAHSNERIAAAAAALASAAQLDAGRLYENLDLPASGSSVLQRRQHQQRRPSSGHGTLLPAPLSLGTSKTPATPLCLTAEQLLASEPSSPSMLYIVLDLDQPATAAATTTATAAAAAEQSAPLAAHASETAAGLSASTSSHGLQLAAGGMSSATTSTTAGMPPASVSATSVLPPDSPKDAGTMDYAKIDFNKTLALSNSTTPSTELDSEESRRTRHSSTAGTMVG